MQTGVGAAIASSAENHFLPFQCKISSIRLLQCSLTPTAQQLAALVHRAPSSTLTPRWAVLPGSGVLTFDHLVPFHCSTSFLRSTAPLLTEPSVPTARQSLADTQTSQIRTLL